MKMEWPVFAEHIIHYVEQYRAEKTNQDKQSKMLAGKLTQLQIGELTKNIKKDREKGKYQAAVTTAMPEAKVEPSPEVKTEPAVTQAPVYTAVMAPRQAQPHTVQQSHSAPAPTAVRVPPIHLHLSQGG